MKQNLASSEDRIGYFPEFDPMRWPTGLRIAAGAAGAALLLRAITNRSLASLFGRVSNPVIRMRRTIDIEAPREDVFDFWHRLENLPLFMSYVKDIRFNDRGGLHWTMAAPAGVILGWDATLGAFSLAQGISWKSVPESPIHNEGRILFRQGADEESTRLEIELIYAPPAGALGLAVARILGFDPRSRIDSDLMKMKDLVEAASPSNLDSVRLDENRRGYVT